MITAWIGVAIASGLACAPNQSPDQIREKTACATTALKRDTKAVAEGVKGPHFETFGRFEQGLQ